MTLSNMSNQLFQIASEIMNAPDSPQAFAVQARIAALQAIDKSLELQLRRVDTQRQSVDTEIESVKKVIDKNVSLSFKTFG